jgi:DNA-binding response OmpR family regulator
VPVIFVSARNEQKARQEAAQAGAIGFLSKPFDDNSLFYVVHKALRSTKKKNLVPCSYLPSAFAQMLLVRQFSPLVRHIATCPGAAA